MNLSQAKTQLEKIIALYKSMSADEKNISAIERDLMLGYIRSFYENFLDATPSVSQSKDMHSTAAYKPPPAPEPKRVVVETPPPNVVEPPRVEPPPPRPVEPPPPPRPVEQPKPVAPPPPPAPEPVKYQPPPPPRCAYTTLWIEYTFSRNRGAFWRAFKQGIVRPSVQYSHQWPHKSFWFEWPIIDAKWAFC